MSVRTFEVTAQHVAKHNAVRICMSALRCKSCPVWQALVPLCNYSDSMSVYHARISTPQGGFHLPDRLRIAIDTYDTCGVFPLGTYELDAPDWFWKEGE